MTRRYVCSVPYDQVISAVYLLIRWYLQCIFWSGDIYSVSFDQVISAVYLLIRWYLQCIFWSGDICSESFDQVISAVYLDQVISAVNLLIRWYLQCIFWSGDICSVSWSGDICSVSFDQVISAVNLLIRWYLQCIFWLGDVCLWCAIWWDDVCNVQCSWMIYLFAVYKLCVSEMGKSQQAIEMMNSAKFMLKGAVGRIRVSILFSGWESICLSCCLFVFCLSVFQSVMLHWQGWCLGTSVCFWLPVFSSLLLFSQAYALNYVIVWGFDGCLFFLPLPWSIFNWFLSLQLHICVHFLIFGMTNGRRAMLTFPICHQYWGEGSGLGRELEFSGFSMWHFL